MQLPPLRPHPLPPAFHPHRRLPPRRSRLCPSHGDILEDEIASPQRIPSVGILLCSHLGLAGGDGAERGTVCSKDQLQVTGKQGAVITVITAVITGL